MRHNVWSLLKVSTRNVQNNRRQELLISKTVDMALKPNRNLNQINAVQNSCRCGKRRRYSVLHTDMTAISKCAPSPVAGRRNGLIENLMADNVAPAPSSLWAAPRPGHHPGDVLRIRRDYRRTVRVSVTITSLVCLILMMTFDLTFPCSKAKTQ